MYLWTVSLCWPFSLAISEWEQMSPPATLNSTEHTIALIEASTWCWIYVVCIWTGRIGLGRAQYAYFLCFFFAGIFGNGDQSTTEMHWNWNRIRPKRVRHRYKFACVKSQHPTEPNQSTLRPKWQKRRTQQTAQHTHTEQQIRNWKIDVVQLWCLLCPNSVS